MSIKLPDFSEARVLVAGDLMLDRYWQGPAARLSPEAPVPVVQVDQTEERPGGAANVAGNIAALGARVSLAGIVGEDEAGQSLQRQVERLGVTCHLQRVAEVQTISKLRVLSRHQQLLRLDFEQDLSNVDSSALQRRIRASLPDTRVLVLSDYAKGTLHDPQPLIRAARDLGIAVLVDPKGGDFERYRGASLLTPNLAEFQAVTGSAASDLELAQRGERLRQDLALEGVLITLGERGMLLLRAGCTPLHIPTRAREVFDVTGAGDTVIAVLAAAIAAGMALDDAAGLANLAAGLVVAKLGASSVTPVELSAALRQQGEWRSLLDRSELTAAVDEARRHGERIVMTNGCFDILHGGHVAYLEQARRLGDRLIVAVNDDASVRRLKGSERPVNALQQRMAVLAGLASVDWVVSFAEDTPTQLICEVKPDLLVKGGDYRPEEIAGHDCVLASGGEVRVLGYLEGQSTSRILDSIRGSEAGR